MEKSLYSRSHIPSLDLIRSICMLGIVQEHFLWLCRNYNMDFVFLEAVNHYGHQGWESVGTAVFFMVSGGALIYNYCDSFDLKSYYISRFIKMLPVLYTTHIMFYLVMSVCNNALLYKTTKKTFFDMLIGKALVGEWFTSVIIACYLLFPILRFLYKRYRVLTTCVIIFAFLLNQKLLLFSCGDQWATYVNGITEFWLGMVFIDFKEKISGSKFFILLGFLIAMPGISLLFDLNGIWFYIPTIISSILLFLVLLNIRRSPKAAHNVSKCSYEIYLVHHRIMYMSFPVFAPLIVSQAQLALFFIILMSGIYCLSEKINVMNDYFVRRIRALI